MLLGILLTVLIIVCIMLIAVILMQRSEGGALGMGGGGGGFLSTRGTADLLTRTTQILGVIFFVLCLAITVLTGRTQGTGSVLDTAGQIKGDLGTVTKGAAPAPAPVAPAQPGSGFGVPEPTIGNTFGVPANNAPGLPPAR